MNDSDEKVPDASLPGEDENLERLARELRGAPEPEFGEGEEEEFPKTKGKLIEEGLLGGVSEEELVAQGFNAGSVRIIAFDLEKAGKRKRPVKAKEPKELKTRGEPRMQVFAKGSPPEVLVQAIGIPGQVDPGFESGMKFGMSTLIAGVRIAQELSNIGVQQARPLIEMAKDMRSGEAMAAKTAALEAAADAAGQVQQNIAPFLTGMDARMAGLEKIPRGENPLRDMMARMMEPVMQGMMSKMMPGMMGGPGMPGPQQGPAPGWQAREE